MGWFRFAGFDVEHPYDIIHKYKCAGINSGFLGHTHSVTAGPVTRWWWLQSQFLFYVPYILFRYFGSLGTVCYVPGLWMGTEPQSSFLIKVQPVLFDGWLKLLCSAGTDTHVHKPLAVVNIFWEFYGILMGFWRSDKNNCIRKLSVEIECVCEHICVCVRV